MADSASTTVSIVCVSLPLFIVLNQMQDMCPRVRTNVTRMLGTVHERRRRRRKESCRWASSKNGHGSPLMNSSQDRNQWRMVVTGASVRAHINSLDQWMNDHDDE